METVQQNVLMTSGEFERWLRKQGCTFGKQEGSHKKVYLGQKRSILPVHGSGHQLGTGLVEKIKKDLGLK